MNNVHITSIELNNKIPSLPFDKVKQVEVHYEVGGGGSISSRKISHIGTEGGVSVGGDVSVTGVNVNANSSNPVNSILQRQQIKLIKFLDSFNSFTTVSFIDLSKLPVWFYLGKPFDIYTQDNHSLDFFKEILKLIAKKDVGLLLKGDFPKEEKTKSVTESLRNEEAFEEASLNKEEFHLLLIFEYNSVKFQAIPLQLTDFVVKRFLSRCQPKDKTSLETPQFLEPLDKDHKNDILNKYSEKKRVLPQHPFTVTGSFSRSNSNLDALKPVVNGDDHNNNYIADLDIFKKHLLTFINAELRLRNVTKTNNKDHQLIVHNVFKMSYFAFRHELADKGNIYVRIDQLRDVVIKLMDILV